MTEKVVVLSSLPAHETFEKINVPNYGSEGIHLVQFPGTNMWVCHASPLHRRLALPLIKYADKVVLLYNKHDRLSMLRARQWQGDVRNVYHNTFKY